jgi:hypothetical protein
MIAVRTSNPRALVASIRLSAKVVSAALAVSTVHATRQPRHGADGGVDLVAVEPAALAGRDGGAVAPGGVGVAVALALRAVLGEVALAVGVGGQVGAVDGDVAAHVRVLGVQGRGHGVDAACEQVAVDAQLAVKR